jgi:para-nitrobenzyl esterase
VQLPHGGILKGALESGIAVYRGVRYAQRPFGKLRFERPAPVPAWVGVVPALEFAPASPQAPRESGSLMFGGEDCLALNIWVPEESGEGCELPVMVWVPGGAYMRGDAAEPVYDGAAFARQGIVFVSVNYRVGIDGFMTVPGATPNRGLLDLVAALEWIQQCIKAFGGDASRITLAGGSAGGGAIACLMGMPIARGFFQRAILQSPSVAVHTAAEADVAAAAIAGLLDVPMTKEALSAVSLPSAVAAVKRLADDPVLRKQFGFNTRNFFPLRAVVDGEVLKAVPLQGMASSWQQWPPDFSVLVGCNRDEMRLYAVPTGLIEQTTEDGVKEFASDVGLPEEGISLYAEDPVTHAQRTPGETLCAMQSDYFYRIPARKIARDASTVGVTAYLYEFSWPSHRFEGRLGAAHGLEIPFVFNQLVSAAGAEITGPGAPPALAQAMHEAWVRYVKQGDPGWLPHSGSSDGLMQFAAQSRFETSDWNFRGSTWPRLL